MSKWRRIKHQLHAEQHGLCAYCDCAMLLQPGTFPQPPNLCTVDHVLPIIKGGTDAISNLVACCVECNALKKGHTVESLRLMADRVERLIQTRACDALWREMRG